MSDSRVLGRDRVLQGRVFDVAVEDVELPGGRRTQLEILQHPGAAAVLALTDRNEVVLVRQYRHAVGEYLWEIPAGTRDAHEEPIACARRELAEETGRVAQSWTDLGQVLPVPGYSTERIWLFLARDLGPAAQDLDDDEIITRVEAVAWRRAMRWVAEGTIADAKTIAALCRARQRGLLADEALR